MLRRRTAVLVVTGLFTAALALSLLMHGTGVVRNDPARNIWIPGELTMPLKLQVAYNDRQIFFRYRSGLHLVAHQHAHVDAVRLFRRADTHWIGHVCS